MSVLENLASYKLTQLEAKKSPYALEITQLNQKIQEIGLEDTGSTNVIGFMAPEEEDIEYE